MKRNLMIAAAVGGACLMLVCFCLLIPPKYTIRFWWGDTLLYEESVKKGQIPACFEPEQVAGASFIDWDQPLTAVQADTDYHAVYAADLRNHVPYLFPDEEGWLHPEEPFTGEQLQAAVKALAEPEAWTFLPELPQGADGLTADQLRPVLMAGFPVMAESALEAYASNHVLTRAEAAAVLNQLLCRFGEKVAPEGNAMGFPDVPAGCDGYADLMEAAVPHKKGGMPWEDILLQTAAEPGWQIREGRLRLFDENGYPVMDTVTEDGFALDREGYYTSGSPELDALITEHLADFQKENPDADRETLLRCAYDYVRDETMYLRRNYYDFGETGWEIEEALTMLTTGRGNCYTYAAGFWAFARGLGYDAVAISGLVGGQDDNLFPHGWVRIDEGEDAFYYDTELEDTQEPWMNWDLFKVGKKYACAVWRYVEPTVIREEADDAA